MSYAPLLGLGFLTLATPLLPQSADTVQQWYVDYSHNNIIPIGRPSKLAMTFPSDKYLADANDSKMAQFTLSCEVIHNGMVFLSIVAYQEL